MSDPYYPTREPDPQEAIDALVGGHLAEIHTGVPGRIEKFDGKSLVDVKPLLSRKYAVDNAEGDIVAQTAEYPVIPNVPVAWPRGGGWVLKFPLKKGDPCWLMFAERSLDKFLDTDGASVVDQDDARRHHLSDAVCYPGMTTAKSIPFPDNSTDLLLGLEDGSAVVQITAGGLLRLGAVDGNKPLALADNADARLSALESWANSHMHPTAAPGPPSPPVTPLVPGNGGASTASTKVFTDA